MPLFRNATFEISIAKLSLALEAHLQLFLPQTLLVVYNVNLKQLQLSYNLAMEIQEK
jgi:hypothetical protein